MNDIPINTQLNAEDIPLEDLSSNVEVPPAGTYVCTLVKCPVFTDVLTTSKPKGGAEVTRKNNVVIPILALGQIPEGGTLKAEDKGKIRVYGSNFPIPIFTSPKSNFTKLFSSMNTGKPKPTVSDYIGKSFIGVILNETKEGTTYAKLSYDDITSVDAPLTSPEWKKYQVTLEAFLANDKAVCEANDLLSRVTAYLKFEGTTPVVDTKGGKQPF